MSDPAFLVAKDIPEPVAKVVTKEKVVTEANDDWAKWFWLGVPLGALLASIAAAIAWAIWHFCCNKKEKLVTESDEEMPIVTLENEPKVGDVKDNNPLAASFDTTM